MIISGIVLLISSLCIYKIVTKYNITYNKIRMLVSGTYDYCNFRIMTYFLRKCQMLPQKTSSGYIIPYIMGSQYFRIYVENSTRHLKSIVINVVVYEDGCTDGKDWTKKFIELMGHNTEINQFNLTPKKLGFSQIKIETAIKGFVSFSSNDKIKL